MDYYHKSTTRRQSTKFIDLQLGKNGDEDDFLTTDKHDVQKRIEEARTEKGKAIWDTYMEQQKMLRGIAEEDKEEEEDKDTCLSPSSRWRKQLQVHSKLSSMRGGTLGPFDDSAKSPPLNRENSLPSESAGPKEQQ